MKKILVIFLVAVMALSAFACSKNKNKDNTKNSSTIVTNEETFPLIDENTETASKNEEGGSNTSSSSGSSSGNSQTTTKSNKQSTTKSSSQTTTKSSSKTTTTAADDSATQEFTTPIVPID